MPRIGSTAGRSLAGTATKRSFSYYAFNSANISTSATVLQLGGGSRVANSSAWTITTNNVSFVGTGLPYHSYGSAEAANTPGVRNYNLNWTYRGGTKVEGPSVPTGAGLIGIWLNGVAMFNPSAQTGSPAGPNLFYPTWQYNAASESGRELGYTFGEDLAGGHAAPPNQYHYH